MKVLVFHLNGDLYGASRSLLRLVTRLSQEGHEPVVVLGSPGPLGDVLTARGIRVVRSRWMAAIERHHLKSPWGVLTLGLRALVSVFHYLTLIRKEDPDVVHTNASVVLTSGVAAKLSRRPHVWHIRETFTDFPALWRAYRHFVSAFSDRIVCISSCVAHQFPDAGRRSDVSVVYNGIPAAELTAPSERLDALREELGLEGCTCVGVVGRINLDRKGQDVVVEATRALASDHPDLRVLVIGSPYPGKEDHEERLRSLIRARGLTDRVILTGEVESLPDIYGLLDVLVVPSTLPEGFGNTAPEAMAYGIPVVGSDLGGTAEIVEHGETGFLVPPGNADALAACLDLLLSDPGLRDRLGEHGRSSFAERFEFETCYRGMIGVFESLVGEEELR